MAHAQDEPVGPPVGGETDGGRPFDLGLFLELNAEYADTPLVPAPRTFTPEALSEQATNRARTIENRIGVVGQRVLEVGCGRGHLGETLTAAGAREYVGVDVVDYDTWPRTRRGDLELVRRDISTEPSEDLGRFDRIVSLAVLEHVVHPHAMLAAMYERLRPGGLLYLSANLYRGPKASHRYRQVFFPWPHLLFEDAVWREFYRQEHGRDETFSWVNKLTFAQYEEYFRRIGFERHKVWRTPSTFDEDFYRRFEDRLSRYPRSDLAHDFVFAVLERPAASDDGPAGGDPSAALRGEVAALRAELAAVRASRSWRVTRPLRALSRRLR